MGSLEIACQVIDSLNELGLPYMVVGSLSSNFYGVARNTKDADILIETDDRLPELYERLQEHFAADPQIGFETVQMTTKHVIRHHGTGFSIELFVLSNDEHDRLRFQRRIRVQDDPLDAYLPTPEDVIIQKLRWARRKDMEDVIDVLLAQHKSLDWPYIRTWCERHGSMGRLQTALDEAGLEMD